MKNDIQEKIWKEAGETFEGLIEYLNNSSKDNELLNKLLDRKEKAEILKAIQILEQ